jgi:hypothetical protein
MWCDDLRVGIARAYVMLGESERRMWWERGCGECVGRVENEGSGRRLGLGFFCIVFFFSFSFLSGYKGLTSSSLSYVKADRGINNP